MGGPNRGPRARRRGWQTSFACTFPDSATTHDEETHESRGKRVESQTIFRRGTQSNGQQQPKSRAVAWIALDLDAPAVGVDNDLVHNRQAQSRAAGLRCQKGLEQALLLLRCHAHTGVPES